MPRFVLLCLQLAILAHVWALHSQPAGILGLPEVVGLQVDTPYQETEWMIADTDGHLYAAISRTLYIVPHFVSGTLYQLNASVLTIVKSTLLPPTWGIYNLYLDERSSSIVVIVYNSYASTSFTQIGPDSVAVYNQQTLSLRCSVNATEAIGSQVFITTIPLSSSTLQDTSNIGS